jgi:two-component system, NarL family, nitrate/nitrite response regulator NarL
MSDIITVGIVDDHPMMREGVAYTLIQSGKFSVVGMGGKGPDAVRLAQDHLPEILLLDINMPGGGIEAARQINVQCPVVKIVMLTISENQEHVCDAMEAGARGYILKGISAPELVSTLLSIHEGQSYVTPQLAARLLRLPARGYILKGISAPELVSTLLSIHEGQSYVTPQLAARLLRLPARGTHTMSKLDDLTQRETEILGSVAKGMTNKEIARALNLSEKTVKHYMTNVMQKLQVRNRLEAVLTLRGEEVREASHR